MNSLLVAPAIMVGIGLFFGTILAIAQRFLKVDEDPRIETTNELLPGTPGECTVSTDDALEEIAEYLEVDAGRAEKLVARLRCGGGGLQAHQIAEYQGFEGCRAAAIVSGGGKGEVACTFDAIHMNANGLPQVDTEECRACPDCVAACPRDLFELVPLNQQLYVQCNIPLAGEAATQLCEVACDACGKCAADAAPGLITMQDTLPVIDYASGGEPRPDAVSSTTPQAVNPGPMLFFAVPRVQSSGLSANSSRTRNPERRECPDEWST